MTQLTVGIFVAIVIIYIILWLLIRWHRIALSDRYSLQVQIESVRNRALVLRQVQSPPYAPMVLSPYAPIDPNIFAAIDRQLKQAQKYESGKRWKWGDWIFWSRGRELASWRHIHDAERLLVNVMPEEQVDARLITAGDELHDLDRPEAKKLADDIIAIFPPSILPLTSPPSQSFRRQRLDIDLQLPHKRAMLVEALRIIYDERDNRFGHLDKWYGKSLWFFLVAILIVFAAGILENPELLLIGAIGGFLSRLQRVAYQPRRSNDYGVSWSTLFLSPLVGAINAWGGILVVSALVEAGVLSGAFEKVTWEPSTPSPTVTSTAAMTPTMTASPAATTTTATTGPTATGTATATVATTSTAVAATAATTSTAAISATVEGTPAATSTAAISAAAGTAAATSTAAVSATPAASPTATPTASGSGTPPSNPPRHSTIVLALALLLGFSERLFDSLGQRLEQLLGGANQPSGGTGGTP